jgi:hypothetical protein
VGRKPIQIKGDPLAPAPSVMEGILDRNRERGGRSAPEESPTPVENEGNIDSKIASYQDSKIAIKLSETPLVERVIAISMVRHQGMVQLGARIPATQKDRLENIQIRLRKQGVTNQGILIAALDAALEQIEREIEAS